MEVCTTKEEVLAAVKRFEKKIAARDHTKDSTGNLDDSFKI